MNEDGWRQILSAATEQDAVGRVCALSVPVLGVSGAGLSLLERGATRVVVFASDETAHVIEDLQFTTGEGPCVDATTGGAPVVVSDWADVTVGRWPAFRPGAVAAGVGAMFVYPLRAAGACLGSLDLYRSQPGPLTVEQFADGAAIADVITWVVAASVAEAAPGTVPEGMIDESRLVVHQATGMVALQLGVRVGEALLRLRAYAYANQRPLDAVANDVVAGRLSLH